MRSVVKAMRPAGRIGVLVAVGVSLGVAVGTGVSVGGGVFVGVLLGGGVFVDEGVAVGSGAGHTGSTGVSPVHDGCESDPGELLRLVGLDPSAASMA
jgi:hypothetical protein